MVKKEKYTHNFINFKWNSLELETGAGQLLWPVLHIVLITSIKHYQDHNKIMDIVIGKEIQNQLLWWSHLQIYYIWLANTILSLRLLYHI